MLTCDENAALDQFVYQLVKRFCKGTALMQAEEALGRGGPRRLRRARAARVGDDGRERRLPVAAGGLGGEGGGAR